MLYTQKIYGKKMSRYYLKHTFTTDNPFNPTREEIIPLNHSKTLCMATRDAISYAVEIDMREPETLHLLDDKLRPIKCIALPSPQ